MTTNDKLVALSDLQVAARRMREREENLLAIKRNFHSMQADVHLLASEQGQDILLVKTRLEGVMASGEWFEAHVPNMDTRLIPKYERCSKERLDYRQLEILFRDEQRAAGEAEQLTKVKRSPAPQWELGVAAVTKLSTCDYNSWPEQWKEEAKAGLEFAVEGLGGKIIWS